MSNYVWTVSSGGTITSGGTSSDNTVTITWNSSGEQKVSVNYNSSEGCSASNSTEYNVTVNALPNPTITGLAISCLGSSANVYTTESGMSNYVWTVSSGGTITSGGTASDNTVTITWNSMGEQKVSVSYTSSMGCVSDHISDYIVNIKEVPTAIITGGETLCQGESTPISVLLTGNQPWNITYQRDGANDITVNGITSSPYVFDASLNGTYTINSVSDASCTGEMSGSAVVIVNSLPIARFIEDVSMCEGESAQVSLALTGTPPWNITYQKDGANDVTIQNITSTNHNFSIIETGNYSVSKVSDANCEGVSSESVSVSLYDVPTATMSGDGNICEAENAELIIDFTGIGPWEISYTLNGENEITLSNITDNPFLISTSNEGVYALTQMRDVNCNGIVSGDVNVIKHSSPSAVIGGDGSVCGENPTSLSLALTGDSPWNVVYQRNGVEAGVLNNINETPFLFDVTEPGTYTLLSVTNNGCEGNVGGSAEVSENGGPVKFNMVANDREIGLDGSQVNVSYNVYLNNNPTEVEVIGTGNAISFGDFNTEGTYTVYAYHQETLCSSEMNGSINLEFGTNGTQGGAINIFPVDSWCSLLQEYSTVGASPDGSSTSCLPSGPNNNVWFRFKAVSKFIRISLYTGGENGTIKLPSIALWDYENNIQECVKSSSVNDKELFLEFSSLVPGKVYYISIDNESGAENTGTFSLCVNNNLGAKIYYAIANGNWIDNIWSTNPNATTGIGIYPGVEDIVYIIDKIVQVNTSVSAQSVYIIVDESDANLIVNTGGHVDVSGKVIVQKK